MRYQRSALRQPPTASAVMVPVMLSSARLRVLCPVHLWALHDPQPRRMEMQVASDRSRCLA